MGAHYLGQASPLALPLMTAIAHLTGLACVRVARFGEEIHHGINHKPARNPNNGPQLWPFLGKNWPGIWPREFGQEIGHGHKTQPSAGGKFRHGHNKGKIGHAILKREWDKQENPTI